VAAVSGLSIEEQAARWVARMDAGELPEVEEEALQAWLADDPRRHGALLHAQAAWMALDPALAVPAMQDDTPSRVPRRRVLAYGGAAIAASLAAGIFLFDGAKHYATDVGEIRRVPLADGSIATINTASNVEIRLARTRREVRIESGEAWFQVAKDRARPFIVAAGRVRVQAVGTAFSVRRRDNGAEILVTEGVVEAWADGADGHRVRLTAGTGAFIADNAAIAKKPEAPSSVDRTLAWRSGKIDLAGDRLDAAAAEFNRYNHRQLVIADPALGAEQIDGIFRTDDPEGFALAVQSSFGVPVDISDPGVIRIGHVPR